MTKIDKQEWTIEISKIPKYPEFEGEAYEELDYNILQLIYDSEDLQNKPEIRANLLSVINSINKRTGILKINCSQRKGCGRFYADESKSLIPLSRSVKHTVFKYLGWRDIDMVKGHPSIAIEMAKAAGLRKLEAFETYAFDFDTIVKEISDFYSADLGNPLDKDNIKWLFNSMIYGGGFNSWIEGVEEGDENYPPKAIKNRTVILPFIEKFIKERDFVMNKIYKENPALAKKVAASKETTYEKKCCVCSYWFQTIENHIVYKVAEFLLQRKILRSKRYGKEYDGLNIPPVGIADEEALINDVNCYVNLTIGMGVSFKFKSYDEETVINDAIEKRRAMIIEPVEEENDSVSTDFYSNSDKTTDVVVEGVQNDKEAAVKVFQLYPHWVCCLGELYVFDDETGLWSNEEFTHFKVIGNFEEHLHIIRESKDGKMIKSPKGYGNTTTLMRQLIPQLKALNINNEWLKNKQNSSLGMLLFNNGYLNFRTMEFHSQFNPDIVFVYKIHHNYEKFYDEDMEYMKSIEERFFTIPLGASVADHLILNLSRALAGDVMKRILFGLGGTNCGKSVLTRALASALGEYCGSFNAECLAYNKSSADEAAQMRWVYLLRYKRIIFSNEMKSTIELNGNMIKKISSGGDSLIARDHCKAETEFVPQFLTMCMSNDLNKITPYDDAVAKRVRVIPFTRQFVDEPSNEFELKKDDNIESELETDLFKRVFVGLLVKRYLKYLNDGMVEPECNEVIRAKCDWIGDDNEVSFVSKFQEEFTITNNADDFVESSDIEEWIKRQKFGITMKKFGMELKKFCAIHKNECVYVKVKKINGKAKNVWVGIKLQLFDEPDENNTSTDETKE